MKICCSISWMARTVLSFRTWWVFEMWRNLKLFLSFRQSRGNFPGLSNCCGISQLSLFLWKGQSPKQVVVEKSSPKDQSSKLQTIVMSPFALAILSWRTLKYNRFHISIQIYTSVGTLFICAISGLPYFLKIFAAFSLTISINTSSVVCSVCWQ